jgi:hypothetical protein
VWFGKEGEFLIYGVNISLSGMELVESCAAGGSGGAVSAV